MKKGFIESCDSNTEAHERKNFWNNQLEEAGLSKQYRAVVHLVKADKNRDGVYYAWYGVFVEEIRASNKAKVHRFTND